MSYIQHARGPAWLYVLLTGFVLAGAGCRALPGASVQSFGGATSTLRTTVSAAGNTAVQDIAEIHDGTPPSQQAAAALSAELKKEWSSRLKMLEAMDRYAASLTALVESGEAGQENAGNFIDSIKGLAAAVEVAVPPSAALTAALQLAERAYGRIAAHLAARQIHEAVEKADPAVAALAALIAEDLFALRSIAVERRRTALTQMRARSPLVPQFNSMKRARERALSDLIAATQPAAAAGERLRQLDAAHAAMVADPEYITLIAHEAETDRLFRAQADLLDQAAATVAAWAATHHDLALALRQKRTPSLHELTRMAADLYDIYKDYRRARGAAASGSRP